MPNTRPRPIQVIDEITYPPNTLAVYIPPVGYLIPWLVCPLAGCDDFDLIIVHSHKGWAPPLGSSPACRPLPG